MVIDMSEKEKETKEDIEIKHLKKTIQGTYSSFSSYYCDVGSMKKVIPLNAIGHPQLALATSISNTSKDEKLIGIEYFCIEHLKSLGFPIVDVIGEPFIVEESETTKRRMGMLMKYVHRAKLIEAKTPDSYKFMILATLLDVDVPTGEAWALRKSEIQERMDDKIDDLSEEEFLQLKNNASIIGHQIIGIIDKLLSNNIAISDLQIVVGADMSVTIIDPLDIIIKNNLEKSIRSLATPSVPFTPYAINFLKTTDNWLSNVYAYCNEISKCTNQTDLKSTATIINTITPSEDDPDEVEMKEYLQNNKVLFTTRFDLKKSHKPKATNTPVADPTIDLKHK